MPCYCCCKMAVIDFFPPVRVRGVVTLSRSRLSRTPGFLEEFCLSVFVDHHSSFFTRNLVYWLFNLLQLQDYICCKLIIPKHAFVKLKATTQQPYQIHIGNKKMLIQHVISNQCYPESPTYLPTNSYFHCVNIRDNYLRWDKERSLLANRKSGNGVKFVDVILV